jgi:hypothetical protein
MANTNICRSTIQPRPGPSQNAKTQRAAILDLLIEARGSWVPLPTILELHISQFGARIFELRRTGFSIENKIEHDNSGVVHLWYRLLNPPKATAPEPVKEKTTNPDLVPSESSDWYEREHGPRPAAQPQVDDLPLFQGVRS